MMNSDRNFDDLALKFRRKVYGGLKGRIRLAVLEKDLTEFYPDALKPPEKNPIKIMDAGGGYGPFSLRLAKLGHEVTLCDLSEKMLEFAPQDVEKKDIEDRVTIVQSPIQELPCRHQGPYDMVLCHAVLEWVHDPEDLIKYLIKYLKPGGILSLTFYNLVGMIYKNLLRTNYKRILDKDYKGFPGSLTPTHPRHPREVMTWLSNHPLTIVCHSGMRVFHDYILDMDDKEKEPDTVVDLELKLSRQSPYRNMGRYQHILCKKSPL